MLLDRLITSSHVFLLYFSIYSIMFARLRDIFDLETLRDRYELHSFVERYATNRDRKMVQEATRIYRENYGINKTAKIIAPFKILFPSYFITRLPNTISYCPIPKNMSTVITAIICWLYSEEFRNGNTTLTSDHKRSCYHKNGLHTFDQVKKLKHGEKWINFAMVREPQERFLSGFMFMCLPNNTVNSTCEGCINDIECALRTTLEQARRFAAGDLSARTFLLWHLGPQNWHCHFHRNIDKIRLFKYSPRAQKKTLSDLTWILKEGGVKSSDTQFIISQISKKKTRHATSHNEKRDYYNCKLNDIEMQRMLVELLYWDYVLFNYPLPRLHEKEDQDDIRD